MVEEVQNGLAVYSKEEIMDMEFPVGEAWWGDTLFDKGYRVVLTGHPGCGKSIFALNMIGALVMDEPFLGEEVVPAEHKVLYLDAELQLKELQKRIRKIETKYSLDHLFVLKPTRREPIKLDDAAHIEALISFIKEGGYTIFIIDPLSEFHDKDENNASDLKQVCEKIDLIVEETGVGVIILHHLPKSGNMPRGSTYLTGWADLVFNIGVSKCKKDDVDVLNMYFNKKRYVAIDNKNNIERDRNMIYSWHKKPTITACVEEALMENVDISNEDLYIKVKEAGFEPNEASIRKIRSRIDPSI
ncbi:MAG: hypothetical protein D4S01_06190 [Dehalococcoidia bacterium]|nr:MAG: hypothetical protein D4S01_06190 [Dehalococcoidia bacterium]